MSDDVKVLPLIPLRGIIIFPYMVMHFDVGREKSILALEDAMVNKQEVFLAAQRNAKTESPEASDIYSTGTICTIKQILKLPGDTVRVLVEGEKRGKISAYIENEHFMKVEIEEINDNDSIKNNESIALTRLVKESFSSYIKLSGAVPNDTLISLDEEDDLGRFADTICSYLVVKQEKKQEILEAIEPMKRLDIILEVLNSEIDILEVEKEIGSKVRDKIEKGQKNII